MFEQLASTLRAAPGSDPLVEADEHPGSQTPPPSPELRSWRKLRELTGQSYSWPQGTEEYEPFEVWDGGGEPLELGLGYVAKTDADYYGQPRGYWLAFEMVNGQKRRPICVFLEDDDPTDLVAVIKGKGPGGRSMFSPGDELPAAYAGLTVDVFRHRVVGPQAYNKLALVARSRAVARRRASCRLDHLYGGKAGTLARVRSRRSRWRRGCR